MSEFDFGEWRAMSSAPRDGTRVIVTVRPAEQGPAEVDLAYWSKADRFAAEGWRAADSQPDCPVIYAEVELKGWMPMPAPPRGRSPVVSDMPVPWEGDDLDEESGSGI